MPTDDREPDPRVWRILDANANRASEALRTLEDYARFVRDDAQATTALKHVRHLVAQGLEHLPAAQRRAFRQVEADVGRAVEAPTEYRRDTLADVASAAAQRAQQALRCLEEYGKLVNEEAARCFEQARYATYQLDAALAADPLRQRLHQARLYLLLDGRSSLHEFCELAARVLDAGIDVVQLRDKGLTDRELLERARELRRLTAQRQRLLIVNDRPDVAWISEADGVHLGQEELPVSAARRLLGGDRLIGVSTHNLPQLIRAGEEGADYVGCGPTFPSRTKPFAEFPGLSFLRQAAEVAPCPAFAIGGIDEATVPKVLETGMTRIAVQSAVLSASDPALAVGRLRALLTQAEMANVSSNP